MPVAGTSSSSWAASLAHWWAILGLTNREIAIVVWIVAAVSYLGIRYPDIRKSMWGLLRAASAPAIFTVYALAALFVVLVTGILHWIRLWTVLDLKPTILWFVTYAVFNLSNVTDVLSDNVYLRQLLRRSLAPTLVTEFIVQLYSFPIWVELVLVPVAVLIGLMLGISRGKKELQPAEKALNGLLFLLGLGAIANIAYNILEDFSHFATWDNLRDFLVPVIMTGAFAPLIYLIALYMGYDLVVARLRSAGVQEASIRRTLRIAAFTFRLDLEAVRRWRRNLYLVDIKDENAIAQSLRDVVTVQRRERQPPDVPPELGWSPYAAGAFLAVLGLATGDYHRLGNRWTAKSEAMKLGGDILPDRITYYIEGNEVAATRLILGLDAGNDGTKAGGEKVYLEIAALLLNAIMAKTQVDHIVRRMRRAHHQFRAEVEDLSVSLTRTVWGTPERGGCDLKLVLKHSTDQLSDVPF